MTGYARQDRPSEANVVAQVVRHDVCVGCGICAAVCPVNALRIQFDPRGELQPQLIGPCTQCRKCLGVCPFGPDAGNDEDSLGRELLARQEGACHDNILGWYLTCLVGHVSDPRRRWSRSSGGLASWVLGALLERRLVDRVVCVIPNDDPQQLFRFAVLDRPEQVWSAANSCYYPVEVSEALRRVCQTPGRTAVVGLPCVLKGLRRWARMDGAWNQRLWGDKRGRKCLKGPRCKRQWNKSGLRRSQAKAIWKIPDNTWRMAPQRHWVSSNGEPR